MVQWYYLFLYFLSVPVRLVRPCDVPIQYSVHLVIVHSTLYIQIHVSREV